MSKMTRLHPGLNFGSTDPDTHKASEALMFGFWVFLMSDLVLFALLFATYATMSQHAVSTGPTPATVYDLRDPFIETMLLLTSSFTFGMASLTLKYRQERAPLLLWLLVTFVLGVGFVGMEAWDFAKDVAEGFTAQTSGFLSSFFVLVGTHGVHVSSGLAWMLIMMAQIFLFGITQDVKTRVMRLALFWHMLDVVWVCIFTFVYLTGSIQ